MYFYISGFFTNFTKKIIMAFYLQSQEDETLYFNGTILNKKGWNLALFSPIENAAYYNNSSDASEVSDLIDVPVNIVEV